MGANNLKSNQEIVKDLIDVLDDNEKLTPEHLQFLRGLLKVSLEVSNDANLGLIEKVKELIFQNNGKKIKKEDGTTINYDSYSSLTEEDKKILNIDIDKKEINEIFKILNNNFKSIFYKENNIKKAFSITSALTNIVRDYSDEQFEFRRLTMKLVIDKGLTENQLANSVCIGVINSVQVLSGHRFDSIFKIAGRVDAWRASMFFNLKYLNDDLTIESLREKLEYGEPLNLRAIKPNKVSEVYNQIESSGKTKGYFGITYKNSKYLSKIVKNYEKQDLGIANEINISVTKIKEELIKLEKKGKLKDKEGKNIFEKEEYKEILKKLNEYNSQLSKLNKKIYPQRKEGGHKDGNTTDILFENKDKIINIINYIIDIGKKAGIDSLSEQTKDNKGKITEHNLGRLGYDDSKKYLNIIKNYDSGKDIVTAYSHIGEHTGKRTTQIKITPIIKNALKKREEEWDFYSNNESFIDQGYSDIEKIVYLYNRETKGPKTVTTPYHEFSTQTMEIIKAFIRTGRVKVIRKFGYKNEESNSDFNDDYSLDEPNMVKYKLKKPLEISGFSLDNYTYQQGDEIMITDELVLDYVHDGGVKTKKTANLREFPLLKLMTSKSYILGSYYINPEESDLSKHTEYSERYKDVIGNISYPAKLWNEIFGGMESGGVIIPTELFLSTIGIIRNESSTIENSKLNYIKRGKIEKQIRILEDAVDEKGRLEYSMGDEIDFDEIKEAFTEITHKFDLGIDIDPAKIKDDNYDIDFNADLNITDIGTYFMNILYQSNISDKDTYKILNKLKKFKEKNIEISEEELYNINQKLLLILELKLKNLSRNGFSKFTNPYDITMLNSKIGKLKLKPGTEEFNKEYRQILINNKVFFDEINKLSKKYDNYINSEKSIDKKIIFNFNQKLKKLLTDRKEKVSKYYPIGESEDIKENYEQIDLLIKDLSYDINNENFSVINQVLISKDLKYENTEFDENGTKVDIGKRITKYGSNLWGGDYIQKNASDEIKNKIRNILPEYRELAIEGKGTEYELYKVNQKLAIIFKEFLNENSFLAGRSLIEDKVYELKHKPKTFGFFQKNVDFLIYDLKDSGLINSPKYPEFKGLSEDKLRDGLVKTLSGVEGGLFNREKTFQLLFDIDFRRRSENHNLKYENGAKEGQSIENNKIMFIADHNQGELSTFRASIQKRLNELFGTKLKCDGDLVTTVKNAEFGTIDWDATEKGKTYEVLLENLKVLQIEDENELKKQIKLITIAKQYKKGTLKSNNPPLSEIPLYKNIMGKITIKNKNFKKVEIENRRIIPEIKGNLLVTNPKGGEKILFNVQMYIDRTMLNMYPSVLTLQNFLKKLVKNDKENGTKNFEKTKELLEKKLDIEIYDTGFIKVKNFETFRNKVKKLQREIRIGDDGMYGAGTHKRLKKYYGIS